MSFIQRPLKPEYQDHRIDIEALQQIINEYRYKGDKDRRTPAVVMEALMEAGIHRIWVSRAFGGLQLSLSTGMALIEAIARQDASAAWQMGVQGALSRLSDYLPESSARHLFQNHSKLIVGVVAPSGKAERVDGGFIVNGSWSFASGSAYADWLACAAVVTEKGQAVMTETGPLTRMLFVPKKDYRLLDDWYTTGLRGTASNAFEIKDVFVPEEFTIAGSALLSPPPARPSRAFGIGYYDFGPFTSVPTTLGIAQDALDSFKEMAIAKVPLGGKTPLKRSHTVHEKIGYAWSLLLSSRLLIENAASQASQNGDSGEALSALIRLSASTIACNAKKVVDIVHTLSGATSVYEGNRIEKCFRDINTAVKHITLAPASIEMVGQFIMEEELLVRR
ncbi:Flavin-dependent monooxygenase, oxygenase subunit HsaA [Serratia rubidaea]|uniref:Flavin-dependent monooxygenase, oxygenase subunit HsaA n=1 Tax=Serratia rubidaea TaxID=61652 RepID=A0A3S4FVT4_SERRU|nr:Flavin-dependent monooxygenase, oxygenase subunit HsaA [Serratia rubidaea]